VVQPNVSDEQKEEWATIKDLFLSKFGFGTTANEKLFALQRDISNLNQGENKPISSYADRAKMISKRDNGSLGNLLGLNFVQGMRDDFHKDRVEYSMGLEKNPVTFNTVLEFVKVSDLDVRKAVVASSRAWWQVAAHGGKWPPTR
jgi:hypothetical protein